MDIWIKVIPGFVSKRAWIFRLSQLNIQSLHTIKNVVLITSYCITEIWMFNKQWQALIKHYQLFWSIIHWNLSECKHDSAICLFRGSRMWIRSKQKKIICWKKKSEFYVDKTFSISTSTSKYIQNVNVNNVF